MQNSTDNTNVDVPLIVQNVRQFFSFEIKLGKYSFGKEKQN